MHLNLRGKVACVAMARFSRRSSSFFPLPRRSSHLRSAQKYRYVAPPSFWPPISFTTRIRSKLERTHMVYGAFSCRPRSRCPRLRQWRDVVCYERIVDFPAFSHSPFLIPRTRMRSYSSWNSHKSERSNGRHIRSRFLAVTRRACPKLHEKADCLRLVSRGSIRRHFVPSLWFFRYGK